MREMMTKEETTHRCAASLILLVLVQLAAAAATAGAHTEARCLGGDTAFFRRRLPLPSFLTDRDRHSRRNQYQRRRWPASASTITSLSASASAALSSPLADGAWSDDANVHVDVDIRHCDARDGVCLVSSRKGNAPKQSSSTVTWRHRHRPPPKPKMSARRMEILRFLSGGAAGTVAACITNPLEVIKTQLQSSNKQLLNEAQGRPLEIAKQIMRQDGISGFFRGLPPTLIGIIPSRSAYFYAYQRSKKLLGSTFPEGSPANALIAGFMAGIAGNTLTNPIWMVRTRMQLLIDKSAGQRAYTGYRDAVTTIFREEGIRGFYKGIFASYWGCAEGALQFIIYEQLKLRFIERQNAKRAVLGLPPSDELPKMTYFWTAAASKCIAAIATYPHEVARTRLREQGRAGVFKYKGMWQTLSLMAREEGTKSLYSGMGVHLVKVVPNSALMFLTYEIVRNWLEGYDVI